MNLKEQLILEILKQAQTNYCLFDLKLFSRTKEVLHKLIKCAGKLTTKINTMGRGKWIEHAEFQFSNKLNS